MTLPRRRLFTDRGTGLAAQIEEFIEDESSFEQMGPATSRYPFKIDDAEFRVFVAALDDQLLAYGTCTDPIPAKRLDAIHKLSGRDNWPLPSGNRCSRHR